MPKTTAEGAAQVAELKKLGVDGIKIILESGGGTTVYNRLDTTVAKAVGAAAKSNGLSMVSHTGESRDIADALDAGATGIEHGSMRDAIPASLFERMKAGGVSYDPTLLVQDALTRFIKSDLSGLDATLVQQTAPPELLRGTKKLAGSPAVGPMRKSYAGYPLNFDQAKKNLVAAHQAGVTLTAGTDAGNPLVLHGPGIHREMQLWVEAGLPAAVALQAATHNNAQLLGVGSRLGLIKQGYDASLLLVDGNPLQEISATERISSVFLKGERVVRADLFDPDALK